MTEQKFAALTTDEKLMWLYHETQSSVQMDNNLSERIGQVAMSLAQMREREDSREKDK
jgi:hypothetical protein